MVAPGPHKSSQTFSGAPPPRRLDDPAGLSLKLLGAEYRQDIFGAATVASTQTASHHCLYRYLPFKGTAWGMDAMALPLPSIVSYLILSRVNLLLSATLSAPNSLFPRTPRPLGRKKAEKTRAVHLPS